MKKIKMDMSTAIIRIIVGLMLMGFSTWALVTDISQKNKCSEEVTAKVIRLEEQQIRNRTDYRPVFEYQYDGQIYTTAGYFDRNNHYNVGQTTKLRINPNDPSDAYEVEKSRWYIYPILIAGAGMLLFGIYTVKKARSDKQPEMY
ncbi:MAG: DUF3592 domain-containing protein [Ruminococcus sp.]|nr:DUF3592 domain-containing protein [Ruminococcus sp.]